MKKTIKGTSKSSEKNLAKHEKNQVQDEENLVQNTENLVQHEKDSCEHKGCLCGSNKSRFHCALCVIALLVVCVIGEHIYRYNTNTTSMPLAPSVTVANVTLDPITVEDSAATSDVALANVSEDGKALEPVVQPHEASTESDVAQANVSADSKAENEFSVPVSTLEQILQPPAEGEVLEQALQAAGNANIDELKKTISILEEEVKRIPALEGEIKRLSALEDEVKKLSFLEEDVKKLTEKLSAMAGDVREKWKIWIALKNKMEKDEDFSKELEAFNSAFAGDQELISLMNDLAGSVVVVPSKEEEGIIGTCKKYIRKVVKVKKVNHAKLFEVSGYVLSSLKK
ncbi:hypothetical protein FACS1894122_04880 [Alphaproteobacteria bacterium]|nr:hypothetical protein FACS1894122_04880 [Alphaproteobacteria bacterium]